MIDILITVLLVVLRIAAVLFLIGVIAFYLMIVVLVAFAWGWDRVLYGLGWEPIRWPRTWRGWRTLFWLWLGRCPVHHTRLNVDSALYDDGVSAYCFRCEGIAVWPQGAREALRQNHRAEAAKQLNTCQRPEER